MFAAFDPSRGRELWITDGSSVTLVRDIQRSTSSSSPHQLAVIGKYVYFLADSGTRVGALWRSDGTSGGTIMIDHGGTTKNFNDIPFVSCNGYTYLKGWDPAASYQLWRTDGTDDGTVRLEALVGAGMPNSAACLISKALFVTDGTTLRVTGGTPQSTTQIRQFESAGSVMSFGDNVILSQGTTTGTAL